MTRWHTVISTADRFCSPLAWVWQHRLWSSNHTITRLSSWFGIHGSVLSWFKSYLSSLSFRVKCENNLCTFHTSSCCVPQGSVLGPLLFVMYTTPLSTLISSLSLDHNLYADNTQLFFSFHPLNFDSSISHLQNALQNISSWMTVNLLTLNSSKTEFLLIGLKNHLPLCSKSWLQLWLTSYLRWPNFISLQSLLLSHRQLRCIRPYLDSSTACTALLLLSFTPTLITVILSTTNSLSHNNYPVSSRSRTLLLVLSLKPKSCHITPILRALYWLRISESIEYKLLSLTYKLLTTPNLRTFITSSLFNDLAVLALHPSLLLLGHRNHPL